MGLRLCDGASACRAARRRGFVEARLQEGRPRLGQTRRAKAMRAFARIIAADVLAIRHEARLLAGEIILAGSSKPRFQRPVIGGRRRLGARARLLYQLGVLFEGAAGRPPKAGRTGLAVGFLEDASRQLRRDQDGAVEDVEFKRTGRQIGGEAPQSVGTPEILDGDRARLANVDTALLRRIGDDFAKQGQTVDPQRVIARRKIAARRSPRSATEDARSPSPPPAAYRRARPSAACWRAAAWLVPPAPAGSGGAAPGSAS